MATDRPNISRVVVLIGFAEAGAAPEVVWSLVDAGFEVVAFARRGRASALRHSRYLTCHEITAPEVDLPAALAELGALLVSLNGPGGDTARVLLPLDDSAVWLCSRVQLDPHWVLAGPSGGQADFALDKRLQTAAARAAGFDVPETTLVSTRKELLQATATFPSILKPAESVAASGSRLTSCRKWICASRAELESAAAQWGERVPLLVQPFIAGTGEGVFGLATGTGVRGWSAHRRLRMMNPHGSGSSACRSQAASESLKTKVEELVRAAGWRGLFMIELLKDQSGTPWFVELNGRPWGSMALSRRQGFDYPAWHVALALDPQSSAGALSSAASELVCRHVGRELMHLLFVLRGPKSSALKAWPKVWKTFRDLVHVRRGDVYYNWRRDDPKVFITDCYYTLHDNLFKGGR